MVSQARADSWVATAAAEDGAAAREAARRKRVRYPEAEVPGAKLVPFAAEVGGRWDTGALNFLRRAAGRAAQRHPGLAALGGRGADAVFSSWLGQLSCALQKANVSCLRSAGAWGRGPAPEVRAEGVGPEPGEDAGTTDDWLAEAVEDLIHWAQATAGGDGP